MTPLERLQGGYYNSDPVSAANSGGFGDGGHVVNFILALNDLAIVAGGVVLDAEAIGQAGEMASAAAQSAEAARDAELASARAESGANASAIAAGEAASVATVAARAAEGVVQDVVAASASAVESAATAATAAAATDEDRRTVAGYLTDVARDRQEVAASTQAAAGLRDDAKAFRDDTLRLRNEAAGIVGGDFLTQDAANLLYRQLVDALDISDIQGLSAALSGKASPAQIEQAITDLIGAAPEALNTWPKLVAAIQSKQNKLNFTPEDAAKKGVAGGYAGLGADGKVPASQLDLPASSVASVAGLTGAIGADALSDALSIRSNNAQFAISLARLTGSQQGLAAGVADDFQNTLGVDAATSINSVFVNSGTRGYRAPIASVVAHPNNMTSDAAPAPQTSSTSGSFSAGFEAFKAFDGDSESRWAAPAATVSPWLQRRLSKSERVVSYRIVPYGSPSTAYPVSWKLQGSADGAAWTDIDTRTAQSFSDGAAREYTVATPGLFLFYRLQITDRISFGTIGELEFKMQAATAGMSLRSVSYPVPTAPTRGMLTVLASIASGVISPGMNLHGYLSRDGGVSWTEVTLSARAALSGVTTFEGVVNLSAQPTGVNLKWRVDTSVGAEIFIDAVVMQWGNS